MKLHTTLLVLSLAICPPVQADYDIRQRVHMPETRQVQLLANMRDHLSAIEEITRLLSEGGYGKAADTAEGRLGMTAMQARRFSDIAAFMPEPMRAIDAAMHKAASSFARAAREAEGNGSLGTVFAGLSAVMQQCLACHQAYRVH